MTQQDRIEAYDEYLRARKKTHRMQVKDLSVVKALVPEDQPVIAGLDEMPDYLCTCGESFTEKAGADLHLAEKAED